MDFISQKTLMELQEKRIEVQKKLSANLAELIADNKIILENQEQIIQKNFQIISNQEKIMKALDKEINS